MGAKKDKALRSIFKGGAIMLVGTVASKAMGLLYRLIVGNYLGPEEYGVISVMLAAFSAATTIGNFGITAGVQKFTAQYRGEDSPSKILGALDSSKHLVLVTSSITSLLIIIFSNDIALFLNEPKATAPLKLVALTLPFVALTRVYINFWEAYENMRYTVYTLHLGNNLIKITVAGALVYLSYGYLGAAFGFAFSFVASALIAYYFYRKVVPQEVISSTPEHNYRELFSHSWPLMTAGLLGIITGNIDTFMIQKFIDTTATGLYNAAYPFATMLTAFSGIFGSIFLSNSSKLMGSGEKELSLGLYRTVIKWTSIIVIPIFFAVLVYPNLVLMLFGSEYTGIQVQNTLRLLSIGFMFSAMVGPIGNLYQTYDRTKLNFMSSLLLASVNGIANFFLIQKYGVIGAAIASTASLLAVYLFHMYNFKSLTGSQPYKLSTMKIALSSVIAVSITYLTTKTIFSTTPLWFVPVAGSVYAVVYILMIFATRGLDDEDLMIVEAIEHKAGIEAPLIKEILEKAV